VHAESAKILKQLANIQSKMKKASKRKSEIEINRLNKLRTRLFPFDSLQERKENAFQYLEEFGWELIDTLVKNLNPLDRQFIVFSPSLEAPKDQEQKK